MGEGVPAAAIVAGAILAVDFAVQPLWTDDAWPIWGVKASSIVALGGLDASFFSSDGVQPGLSAAGPCARAAASTVRRADERAHPAAARSRVSSLPAALVALLRDRVPALTLWLVALAILVAPTLQIQAVSAVADVTLVAFLFLALGAAGL